MSQQWGFFKHKIIYFRLAVFFLLPAQQCETNTTVFLLFWSF